MARLFELLEEPDSSNLSSLGKEQCVVDVDTEIPNGVFDIAVAEQRFCQLWARQKRAR